VRSSAGSIFGINHYSVSSLSDELRRLVEYGYRIVCSSLEGEDYRGFSTWPGRKVLVVGNEANGICREILLLADRLVKIPHGGDHAGVESLNASVSAAILTAELSLPRPV
jgi:TrmH family RNA methyltransferase